MNKRGFEISFNFIVSVIIIAFIVAAAGYAINHFLSLRTCAQLGLFYQDVQREVDKSWNSEIARQTFTGTVPSSIKSVCFGNVTRGTNTEQYNSLKRYARQGYLMLYYPPEKACGQPGYKLDHIDERTKNEFRCYENVGGKVTFTISKDSAASLVSITP